MSQTVTALGNGKYKINGQLFQFAMDPSSKLTADQIKQGITKSIDALTKLTSTESWKTLKKDSGDKMNEVEVQLNTKTDKTFFGGGEIKGSPGVFGLTINPFVNMREAGSNNPVPLDVAMFHELSHSVDKNELNTVNKRENPYRQETGRPLRNGYSEIIIDP